MKKFRDLMEAKDTVVFAFGRFNPPTTGHEKLIKKVMTSVSSSEHHMFSIPLEVSVNSGYNWGEAH